MQPLIDADILAYEVGFAAETGWKAITDTENIPPFRYVEDMLLQRIEDICDKVSATSSPALYLTEGRTFRYDIAKQKPYKGNRKENKPWHFKNLRAYMKGVLNAVVVTYIEADDALALASLGSGGNAIVCSRDKDLRQIPGWFYSWELGNQPSYGPTKISKYGHLRLDKGKLSGTGLAFFYSQLLTGDTADNIPGLPGIGPAKAFKFLEDLGDVEQVGPVTASNWREGIAEKYEEVYGDEWEEVLTEQGQLLWLVRRLNEDGSPQIWSIGMEE